MSESPETIPGANQPAPPPNAIETFVMKVATLTAAAVIFLYAATYILDSFISARLEALSFLKGGKAFWSSLEDKLYSVADAPDMEPERKAKILAAIEKISRRYRPYIEAAGAAASPKK